MKKEFSTKWKASKQPRKQRKYRANAPLHLRKKFVNANLSKELRKNQGKRSIQLKKGDVVKIMRGKFKGKTGKVLEVKLRDSRIFIEGIQAKKQDGSKVNIRLQPSNLQIIELSDRAKSSIGELKKTESPEKSEEKTSSVKKEQKKKSMETKK